MMRDNPPVLALTGSVQSVDDPYVNAGAKMAGSLGKFMRAGLALGAVILTSGCVALGGIDRTAFTIDKSVGDARNRSILTNIVRASNNEPLYFYSINQVSGSGLAQYNFSLPAVAEGSRQTIAQDNYTFGATNLLEGQQTGSFQVAVLDSKNFYSGMMAPFELTEINVLLRQGFPRELVYRLAVDDITIYEADPRQPQSDPDHPKGVLLRFVNDPASPESYANFNTFLTAAITHGITIEEYQVQSKAGGGGVDTAGNAGPGGGDASGKAGSSPVVAGRLCSDLALVTDPTALKDVEDSGKRLRRSAHGGSRRMSPALAALIICRTHGRIASKASKSETRNTERPKGNKSFPPRRTARRRTAFAPNSMARSLPFNSTRDPCMEFYAILEVCWRPETTSHWRVSARRPSLG